MAYVEISLLTSFKFLITSDISHHFYVVSPLPFCNYLDTGMVLIRKMIQSIVDSFPELLHAVAASAPVWEQAACGSLSSHQPVLWAPALGDHLPETSSLAEPQSLFTGPPSITLRESISGQAAKSGDSQGERSLEFSRRKYFFSPLHFLGLCNKFSCLRTVSWKKPSG